MHWALNSTRPTTAKDLRGDLEAEMQHHAKTVPDTAARQVMLEASSEDKQNPAKLLELGERAKAAKAAAEAELPAVQRQMRAAIDAACACADAMGTSTTLFNATVSGHHDPDYSDGIEERVVVSVDVAQPPRRRS